MQTQIKFEGQLSPCKCGKQPKPYSERHGKLFFMECSPCGVRTPKFPTKQQAVQAWESSDFGAIAGRAA